MMSDDKINVKFNQVRSTEIFVERGGPWRKVRSTEIFVVERGGPSSKVRSTEILRRMPLFTQYARFSTKCLGALNLGKPLPINYIQCCISSAYDLKTLL